jgi:tripartite-type tricarboxylate transporter receptor subunit TctC
MNMIKSLSRRGPTALMALVALLGFQSVARAQVNFPDHPITMIVPWAAGGVTDLTARALAKASEPILGQPVVILNKPSAGNAVGMAELAKSKPDGYAIGTLASTSYMFQLTGKEVPYDVLNSFTYISYFGDNLLGIVVKTDAPWKSLKDLVEDGRKNPGKYKFGTSGVGTTQHMMLEGIMADTGVRFVHVPQVGGAATATALLGGHLDFLSDASSWASFAEQGQLRVLAVSTPVRSEAFPGAPTLTELGFRSSRSVGAMIAPAGLPEPIRQKLEDAFRKCLDDPAVVEALRRLAVVRISLSGKEAKEVVAEEITRSRALFEKIKN